MEQCYGEKQYGLERQAIRRKYGSIVHKEMGKRALGVVVKAPAGKVGVLSVHLPPKATIAETGVITSEWSDVIAMKQQHVAYARWWAKKTDILKHKTSRGTIVLQRMQERGVEPLERDIAMPTNPED